MKQFLYSGVLKEEFQNWNQDLVHVMNLLGIGIGSQLLYNQKKDKDAEKDLLEAMEQAHREYLKEILNSGNKDLEKIMVSSLTERFNELSKQLERMEKQRFQAHLLMQGNSVIPFKEIPFYELQNLKEIRQYERFKIYSANWNGQEVVVKVLHEGVGGWGPQLEYEINLMSKIQSKFVVGFIGACSGSMAIVMERVKYVLEDKIAELGSKLAWSSRLQIAKEIVYGLEAMHNCGIIHNNLRSSNVLVDDDMHVKICSFGLAKLKGDLQPLPDFDASITAWRAPEVLSPQGMPSEKSDIYAFGMILWELASCGKPYSGLNAKEIRDYVAKGGREKILEGSPFTSLIQKCLSDQPEDRPSLSEIISMLDSLETTASPSNRLTDTHKVGSMCILLQTKVKKMN